MDKSPILIVRQFLLFSLLISITIHSFGQDQDEQIPVTVRYFGNNYLLKIVRNYFRSDPYQNEFGFFLKHLMNDPTLITKTTHLKTDTSLFYFQGVYQNHNPFGFHSDRTEVRLAEQELVVDDSLSLKDTMIVYQLLGLCYNGKAGLASVKNEFTKFNRHYGKHFITQSTDIREGEEIVGGAEDYFIFGIAASPLTVTWIKLDEFQNAFVITLRLKIK
jgi:hypothetical protein